MEKKNSKVLLKTLIVFWDVGLYGMEERELIDRIYSVYEHIPKSQIRYFFEKLKKNGLLKEQGLRIFLGEKLIPIYEKYKKEEGERLMDWTTRNDYLSNRINEDIPLSDTFEEFEQKQNQIEEEWRNARSFSTTATYGKKRMESGELQSSSNESTRFVDYSKQYPEVKPIQEETGEETRGQQVEKELEKKAGKKLLHINENKSYESLQKALKQSFNTFYGYY